MFCLYESRGLQQNLTAALCQGKNVLLSTLQRTLKWEKAEDLQQSCETTDNPKQKRSEQREDWAPSELKWIRKRTEFGSFQQDSAWKHSHLSQLKVKYLFWPGGTPEEMVEAESCPWPLAVMAATWMV